MVRCRALDARQLEAIPLDSCVRHELVETASARRADGSRVVTGFDERQRIEQFPVGKLLRLLGRQCWRYSAGQLASQPPAQPTS